MSAVFSSMVLEVPDKNVHIHPGDVVKLHRFENKEWIVGFGWFSFGGNRPMCGWYLSTEADMTVKPLLLPDLDDIYIIRHF